MQDVDYSKLPRSSFSGFLLLNGTKVPCANLPDGRRVISESGVVTAMTGRRGGAATSEKLRTSMDARGAPYFLGAEYLKPYLPKNMNDERFQPLFYVRGQHQLIKAYDATVLPDLCTVWITARDAGVLSERDVAKAIRAEQILSALAKTGIAALIDEATGFQHVREADDLQRLLCKYLGDSQLTWAQMFPKAFYREMFRLNNWAYDGSTNARPMLVGKLTADIVYERLPDNVLEQLREKNPVVNKATHQRKATHHQFLSRNIGQPHLRDRISNLITLMKAFTTWREFYQVLERVFPKHPTIDDL